MSQVTDPQQVSNGVPEGARVHFDKEAGELSLIFKYWDAQCDVLDAIDSGEYDLVVYRGGYGSGKTVLGARWIMEVAESTPHSDNLVLAQDMSKGGPTTYKGFFKQLPGEDIVPDEGGDPENSPFVKEFNRNKNRVTWHNGAVIRLGSADKWNRYAGGEFNAIWADEVAHYETTDLYKLYEMLISRQRTKQGPNITLWTSTGNGYNQFYDFVERQVDPDDNPLPARIHNVVADSRDNPFLEETDKLARQFVGTAREEEALAGGFAAAEGLVYSQFARSRHVISEERAEELATDKALYGYDHGWNDPRVVADVRRTPYDQYLLYDLFYETESEYQEAVDWLTKHDKPQGWVYAEHEPEHQEAFRKAGYPCEQAIKDLDEGIPEVRRHLETDHSGRPGLLVSQKCTPAIHEFLSYQEEHVGKSEAEDHAMDALRYLIMGDTHGAGPAGTGVW